MRITGSTGSRTEPARRRMGVVLRPARLLPPKRLLTPRSARRLSMTNRGLLPGSPACTRTGLSPAGLIQFSGRTIAKFYDETFSRR